MQRILLAIGGAAVFCAAVTLMLHVAISRGLPATDLVLATSSATLLLSVLTAILAFRAFNRSNLIATEFERLTRSVDAAIKDVSLRSERDTARLEELSATLSDKSSRPQRRRGAPAGAEDSHGPDSRTAPAASPASAHKQARSSSGDEGNEEVDAAIRRMISSGQADLSLQPIIAAGRGEAGGYEVHFHILTESGNPVDMQRLERDIAEVDPAACERLAVVSATEVARRRLSDVDEKRPLHVAISSTLLEDSMEFAAVLDVFRLHPSLARSIVLSLPVDVLEEHARALELLSGLGIRLAVEDWAGTRSTIETMKDAGVSVAKIDSNRLLDRVKLRKGAAKGGALVEMAEQAGIDIIATGVESEEDAVSLIDMGVDLLSGENLSPPRPLEKAAAPKSR